MSNDSNETSADITLQLLGEELFSQSVDVRAAGLSFDVRDVSTEKQFVSGKIKASTKMEDLYAVIPDKVYRPEVSVVFDFASTFCVNTVFETAVDNRVRRDVIPGDRLVSYDTLNRVTYNLADYMGYYHEYVLSYGSANAQKEYSSVKEELDFIKNTRTMNEYDSILFINKVINYFLTSVTINKVKNDISTCSLSFRDNAQFNREGKSTRIFLDQKFPWISQLFVPMLPFSVWARGRLYPDYMFPIFTGYVNRITPGIDQGYASFKIDGKDTLELARILYENVNPSLTAFADPNLQSLNLYSKIFYGVDHIDIVRSMFIGGAITYDDTGKRVMKIEELDTDTSDSLPKMFPIGNFKAADESPGRIVTPDVVLDARGIKRENFSIPTMYQWLKREKYISTWGYNLTPYRTFGVQSFNTYTSTFSNRLELLKHVAGLVYYEFYTDGAGNVHYHPMRLSNDFLLYDSFYPKTVTLPSTGTPTQPTTVVNTHMYPFPYAQVVSNHELTGVSKSYNVEELTTYLILEGQAAHEAISEARSIDLFGTYRDYVNLSRFGYRMKSMTCPLLNANDTVQDLDGNPRPIFDAMAKAFLEYNNGQLYTATVSMMFRPELDLAAPLYLMEDSEVFYVTSITHTIDIGSSATTIANCSFGRNEEESEVDLISYMLHTEMLVSAEGIPVRSVGSVDSLRRNLKYVVPYTNHAKYVREMYRQIKQMNDIKSAESADYSSYTP